MAAERRYLRPGPLVRRILNPALMALGLAPTLAVRGRRSGEWQTIPVNVLELDGRRYLVSVRGESNWTRNLRAAGGGELRRRRRRERFRGVELPVSERPRVIEAYRARWDRAVKRFFERLPDAADHPVFRIDPEPGQATRIVS